MKNKILYFFISIIICCKTLTTYNLVDTKTSIVVPYFEELYNVNGDPFEYIFALLELKVHPKVIQVNKNVKEARFKYRIFDVLVTVYNNNIDTNYTFGISFKTKDKEKNIGIKRIGINNFSFSSINKCKSYGIFEKSGNSFPKWGISYCGREIYYRSQGNFILEVKFRSSVKGNYPLPEVECGPFHSVSSKGIYFRSGISTCENNYFDILPFIKNGTYLPRVSKINVYDSYLGTRKNVIFSDTLKSLNVIKDTGFIEEINYNIAPWVKIILPNGQEGYIFGADIKREGEFWN